MLLSVLNEGLVRFPIPVQVATVTKDTSVVERERLVHVRKLCNRFVVEIARGCDGQKIAFAQTEPGDSSLWVETFPDPLTSRPCFSTRAPVYQINGLTLSHID